MRNVRFHDRTEAGRRLAAKLERYANRTDVLVLGLPRGGVPVAFEVAQALQAPLDVFVVRKLGLPGHEELAVGAIATGGIRVLNEDVIEDLGLTEKDLDAIAAQELRELKRREHAFRGDRPLPRIKGRIVILVDDGLATGSTMRAAIAAVRKRAPARIVVAVPVAAHSTCMEIRREADETVCAETPEPFYAVGLWYDDFTQTTDQEVHDLLERAATPHAPA
jgi:predicted phosphoribosyltransferase